MRIELSPVRIGDLERELVEQVLNSGRLAQGPMVTQFECKFAEMSRVKHAIAVSSGTTALELALRALNLKPGDEVITTPFTFVATINAVLLAGGTVRFADIDPDTFNIDPDAISRLLNGSTKAILPVHLFGLPCDMKMIATIAKEDGLRIVEDAAQAHFASTEDTPVGSIDIGCFSFYATKNVTCGEGGAITTNDDELAQLLTILRNQGMENRYNYVTVGHNYRLTELSAAIGLGQLHRAWEELAARMRNAAFLTAGLKGLPGFVVPTVTAGMNHVWHQYTIRVRNRDKLRDFLGERGIQTGIYYPHLISEYSTFENHRFVWHDDTPRAAQIVHQVLSLPVHGALTRADLEFIVSSCCDYSRSNPLSH